MLIKKKLLHNRPITRQSFCSCSSYFCTIMNLCSKTDNSKKFYSPSLVKKTQKNYLSPKKCF